ncbi:class I SAM-dependent methyltransferase [Chryseosolibacter indicus]|uniref:Methyltransferase domain-containing protein n=1 Tax=Chryseosolibacter indicus TaxID=2782351 RepID=A0ABS5VW73_9BACT|nr:class I SAM-dependent methyltransferase [Chryseosolibacter indicus]MBT1704251.1 methyltransferase domain-containing protein [Chryseosolibacter indicus]
MGVPFDHIASAYNSAFSNGAINQLQRKRLWHYVEEIIPELSGFEMLELNFGSGEDAVLFGERGFNIVATDIGCETLKLTDKKAEQFSMQHSISARYLDLETLDETLFDKKFDLIFSNFGGLNCINPTSLKTLIQKIPSILNPGGRFIAVVMPRICIWETMFFGLRLQFKKAFRRLLSTRTDSDFEEPDFKTWYYSPSQIKGLSKKYFTPRAVRPIGIALPSSLLEEFFSLRKKLLFKLNKIERTANLSFLSGVSDYFVIDLQLKVS